jgi:hypothetical protein
LLNSMAAQAGRVMTNSPRVFARSRITPRQEYGK